MLGTFKIIKLVLITDVALKLINTLRDKYMTIY